MSTNEATNRRASALCRLAAVAGLVIAVSAAYSQAIHRCQINGKVSFSHEPCADARAPATKPGQGPEASKGIARKEDTPQRSTTALPRPAASLPPAAPAFRCDGRLHCSQMTSCNEAKLFLKNCPGVKMDGDGDGVPCEQQWCTGAAGG